MASKLAVAGIIEGSFSEEGLAAMSECEDMTTLMAKELMLGIKDSVEDVSEMFKRMANLKPQTAAWSIFAESLTPVDNTVSHKLFLFRTKRIELRLRGNLCGSGPCGHL